MKMSEETGLTVVEEKKDLRLGAMQMESPGAVVHQATAVATELAKIIDDQKLFNKIGPNRYVKVDGWTTLGAMLGVSPVEREVHLHEFEDHIEYEASVDLVRASDGVRIGGASALCSSEEQNWTGKPKYAVRSMAITRATGKAFRLSFSWIMVLAGYSPTPLEEMDGVIDGNFKEDKPKKKPASDAVTAYWSRATELKVSKEDANAILKDTKNDFVKALAALEKFANP